MVSKVWTPVPSLPVTVINQKFTPSLIASIFVELIASQILEVYRHGLALAVKRSSATSRKDDGVFMFFLLRMAFWIGLVLVLLPRDHTPEVDKTAPQLGASDAISAATAAASDMSQFCKRQPAACEVGGNAAAFIGERAKEGAKKVYQIITEKKPDHTGSIGEGGDQDQGTVVMAKPDTLTQDDLAVDWQSPDAALVP
jgi:hypothetical protein